MQQPKADLSDYDRIGFVSGIYFSKFHQTILKFASENLPENLDVKDMILLDPLNWWVVLQKVIRMKKM